MSLPAILIRPLPTKLIEKIESWQHRVREPALTALLLGQFVALFVLGPLCSTQVLPLATVNGMQVLLILLSYFALPQASRVRALLLVCLVPMAWVTCVWSNQYIGLSLSLVVTASITVAVALAVFQAPRITSHQLLGAVVVYLNLALLFMSAFQLLNMAFSGAFTTAAHEAIHSGELLYFSLTTLTSTGYGDILPVHPLARSLANLEAVVGQLFLAILLARLVSQHNGGRS